ncbi:hypothetical protein M0R04_04880 [Candidatus Dojkabacteria bacterium]|jgi:hypothetical protein|nr:hypothetical protein [Candidatus Dojkabacteria bacterium]
MKKYNIKQKSYTGCNKVVKDYLRNNQEILCVAHNSYEGVNAEVMITDFNPKMPFKYIDNHGRVWDNVKPIEFKYMINKVSEIIRWCESKKWIPDEEGTFWNKDHTDNFCPEMFEYCGKNLSDVEDTWDWRDEWLTRIK